jgi:choline dehydrogenase
MVAAYPNNKDWDDIASMTGDMSWRADNMRNYFKRLENCRYSPADQSAHEFDGWLQTTLADGTLIFEDPKLLSVLLATATALGKDVFGKIVSTPAGMLQLLSRDLNSDSPDRDTSEDLFRVPQAVTNDSSRNTARDFLLDVANAVNDDGSRRYRLDIKLHTLATKVRFDTSSEDKAESHGCGFPGGRKFIQADRRSYLAPEGRPGFVRALKEIIVSGGVFNSPQLLLLSGIGPRDALNSMNIPVVVDLPGTGKNLQDYPQISTVFRSPTPFRILEDCTFNQSPDDKCLQRWLNENGKGPYSSNGVGFVVMKRSSVLSRSEPTDLFHCRLAYQLPWTVLWSLQ